MGEIVKTLAVVTFFYPRHCEDNVLSGTAEKAPSNIPVDVIETVTRGKGRNASTRVLVRSAAPIGWGKWSGRAWFAWVEPAAVKDEQKLIKGLKATQ
jgi:hypothetical protein